MNINGYFVTEKWEADFCRKMLGSCRVSKFLFNLNRLVIAKFRQAIKNWVRKRKFSIKHFREIRKIKKNFDKIRKKRTLVENVIFLTKIFEKINFRKNTFCWILDSLKIYKIFRPKNYLKSNIRTNACQVGLATQFAN